MSCFTPLYDSYGAWYTFLGARATFRVEVIPNLPLVLVENYVTYLKTMDICRAFFSSVVDIITPYLSEDVSLNCPVRFHELLRRLYFHAVDRALFDFPRDRTPWVEVFPYDCACELDTPSALSPYVITPSSCTAVSFSGTACTLRAYPPYALCRLHLAEWHSIFDDSPATL